MGWFKVLAILAIIALWIPASFIIASYTHYGMKFRINDLSAIEGGGTVYRDSEGNYYHARDSDSPAPLARMIYPRLASGYDHRCLTCARVSNEQLGRMREFCVAGIANKLPELIFENPCRSSIPLGQARKTISGIIFILPFVVFFIIKSSRNARTAYNQTQKEGAKYR